MNTISQVRATAAAVIGARHLRTTRNGQDAAAVWAGDAAGDVVVCDGCGSGASSEVGARIGAQLVIAALSQRLAAGRSPADPAVWAEVRAEVVAQLGSLASAMRGDLAQVVHEQFLFTIVSGAVAGDDAAVWVLGDGAYAIDGRTQVLGPFADNQPPYLAYDLLDMAQPAHLATTSAVCGGTIVVATDGVAELGLEAIAIERSLAHPDALRRRLAVLARGTERIEWDARRVVRAPAALQDDGAVAILARRGRPS
ncbi:MAG: protein phosphatase 2C domain-containing protein [Polyangiales bacterium]